MKPLPSIRQAITTKFISPTNFRGPQVFASCEAGTYRMPWAGDLGVPENHMLCAKLLIKKLGWDFENSFVTGCLVESYVHILIERDEK